MDLTNASVFSQTPDYDLGMRTENLQEKYLTPLMTDTSVPFDQLALHILDEEHASDIQSEMTALRLMHNPCLWAFDKHSSDVTEFHMILMDYVNDTLFMGYGTPPEFQAPYLDPKAADSF